MEHADLEKAIREQYLADDVPEAVTIAVRGYGPELLGYLAVLLSSVQDAEEVFADACADMWRGASGFRWHSSFRTWAYSVTRHAAFRYRKNQGRQLQRLVHDGQLPDIVAKVRTQTARFLRTEARSKVARLRAELSPSEQELLVLRIDRGLTWDEIAKVTTETERDADAEQLRRASASCRKRFERAKKRLRDLAKREGFLES